MGKVVEKFVFPEKSFFRPEMAEEFLSALPENVPDFAAQGIPTPRLERWKYTNLARAVKDMGGTLSKPDIEFKNAPDGTVYPFSEANVGLEALVKAKPPQEEKYQDGALWFLSTGGAESGYVIDVPADKKVEKPVEIVVKTPSNGFSLPRLIIRVQKGAELTVIERHEGNKTSWNNVLTQIIVEKGAHLHHYRVQAYGENAVYTQNTHVQIARDATYEGFTFTTGAGLSRNQIHAGLQGVNGTCNLYGINMLRGKQLGDTTITIEHHAPHCNSNQFYRSVLDGTSHGVFQGKVHVHQAAQKTDGYQLANALILSQGAEMDTKPELEIYADDVKCSHGATTGQLDEDALFYFQSRGLPREEARALLIEAFVNEAVEKLADKSLDKDLQTRIQSWLA